jgi:hypothetical protein
MPRSKVSEAMKEGLNVEYETAEEPVVVPPPNAKKEFDFNKYKVNLGTEVKTLSLEGAEFDVTVKPLSWSKKNQFLSKSLKWDSDGNTVFDGDAYVRECLKEMVIAAPWGKTSELFLISIDERLGNVLEQLVPQAFSGSDVGGEVDNLKDGS